MTPDKARDKLDLLYAARAPDAHVARAGNAAIGQLMGRFLYSREEAEDELYVFFRKSLMERADKPKRTRPLHIERRNHKLLAREGSA